MGMCIFIYYVEPFHEIVFRPKKYFDNYNSDILRWTKDEDIFI